MVPFEHVIGLSAILFVIGIVGVVTRRNLLVILMCVEIMLCAANLAFVTFNRMWPAGPGGVGEAALDGQMFVLIVAAVATAQVAVGMAILISMFRNRDSVDVDDVSLLKW